MSLPDGPTLWPGHEETSRRQVHPLAEAREPGVSERDNAYANEPEPGSG